MRNDFSKLLYERMEQDERIWLITGDLGFGVFNDLRDRFPDRFLNTGAAEQAMMGISIGLALEGKIPFVYSIATFLLYRPFEAIRNYIQHERIPVKLIASGRGRDYNHDGISHWSEDADKLFGEEAIFSNISDHWPESAEELPKILDSMLMCPNPEFLSLKR